jgi:exodeoxyribonuclease V gamma subunit
MLHIHSSNRLEYLLQALSTIIKNKPLPPLIPEVIVVQNQGMERWVSMELAKNLGIWANGYFPFPNALLWRVFKEALGYLPDTSQFEREVMVWSLMDILHDFKNHPEFSELNGYLQDDMEEVKMFQLAWRIAEIFDHYVMYRPTWIADWENGNQPEELKTDFQARWQALLWRAIVARHGTQHLAKLRAEFFRKVQRLAKNPRFQRISVFGISTLPPFHLEVLAEMGRNLDIQVFLVNPCQLYWGDIVSDGEMAHKKTPQDLQYVEKGNTLLASMGKMGRDFMDMLNEYPHAAHEYFENPSYDTLLHCIQSDILELRDADEARKVPIDAHDESIQIHACHSPLREVEVLHDQLLQLFEANKDLLPKDVLVMMPDIEKYAPFIEAVFDTTPKKDKRIPFNIADRNLRNESALIESFFAILALNKSRFSVTEVLGVLEGEAVQRRFGLNESDLELIRYWIEETGIRWGIDKADKQRRDLPAFDENTWRAGLKRLLLGYALPKSSKDTLFHGILPFNDIEGSETLILGKLVAFIENLFETIEASEHSRPLSEWAKFFTEVLDRFLSPDEDSELDAQKLRHLFNSMVENANLAQFNAEVSREMVLAYLRHFLELEPQQASFLTGSVSFCAMLPMRSIPFKVLCLIGMDDQAYPRSNKPLGFDLVAKNPRRGDRSRRNNDRYLFLEALLSARNVFYISYVGQNIQDNTIIPPSVLVSELLDYINKGFLIPKETFVTQHPLQAFSPRYFNGLDKYLFSYSSEYCTASRALMQERRTAKGFIVEALPEPDQEWKTVEIHRLIKFLKNPIEFLLKQRLGIVLSEDNYELNETEPFELKGLAYYKLNQTLVEKQLEGIDLDDYQSIVKASGLLPHGEIGDYAYREMITKIQPFVEQVKSFKNQKRDTIVIKLQLGEMLITGHLNKLWGNNLIHYRYATLKTKDYIQLWIEHLLLNSLKDPNLPCTSLLIGLDKDKKIKVWEYQPVKNSQEILETLLHSYYWQGLIKPLHFFPDSSLTFAEILQKNGNVETAFEKALEKWQGKTEDKQFRSEGDDNYYRLCFGPAEDNSALEHEHFQNLAQSFFEPLLACRRVIR